MMNRISLHPPFLGVFGWLGIVGVVGTIFGIGLSKPDLRNLLTEKVFEQGSLVPVNGTGMGWTNRPHVHSVTQIKGTVLRVRSYIHGVEGGNPLTGKTISF